MKKHVFFLMVTVHLLLSTIISSAQNGTAVQFDLQDVRNPHALTRTGNMHKTSDGGFIFCGTYGEEDIARAVVIKTDASFNPLWYYHLNMTLTNGFNWQASYGADVLEISPNRYALLAGLNQFNGTNAYVIQNLDYAFIVFEKNNSGISVIASKTFGGDNADVPNMMIRTQDGGYMLSGYSNSEQAFNTPTRVTTYLVKLDANFTLQWQKRFQNTANECFTTAYLLLPELLRRPVVQTSDGGFVFNVACDEFNYISKVNNSGELLWTKRFNSSADIGDGITNNGGNFILGAAGTGGSIIAFKELKNGDLAFMGNQFSYVILFFGGIKVDGGGVSLPMGYLFTTDAAGNYKSGSGMAFFQERRYDPNLPIEMTIYDFEEKANGNFLITCGLDKYVDGGNFYYPSLVEIDPTQHSLDAGFVKGIVLNSKIFYTGRDYPYGLNKLIMSQTENLLVFQGGNMIPYEPESAYLVKGASCQKNPNTMHTFGFNMELSNSALYSSTASSKNVTVQMNMHAAKLAVPCSLSEVENVKEEHPIHIQFAEGLTLHSKDDYWLGGYYRVYDLAGKEIASGQISAEEQHILRGQLSNGMYFASIRKGDKSLVLKSINCH